MANLARSVHSSNDHFQRKTENSKKREAREEKEEGGERRDRSNLFQLKPRIIPFLAETSAKQAIRLEWGAGGSLW